MQLYRKAKKASEIIRKVGRESWIKAIRESREER